MSQYRPVAERVRDYLPVELRMRDDEMTRELKRCQDCGIPFCHAAGCPLANVVPEINIDALNGHWDSALARLTLTSPFPEFTSRVCPALCEGSCVQGLDSLPVPARQVEYEVVERGFASGLIRPRRDLPWLDLKVGIVGSGPSGLAAAWKLRHAGARVTVYEKDAKPGGFLRYGIPDFKLEKSVVDRRLDLMRAEGVRFVTSVEAGLDISAKFLKQRHHVLILALGSRRKRDLLIPGRELGGVFMATDYLSAQNRVVGGEIPSPPPEMDAFGKRVVVVGGGDTGSDCVGTAWRQGATEVWQIEIMPKPPEVRAPGNPWPQWPRILRTTSSHQEGGERRWSVETTEFLPQEGWPQRLGGLRCQEVERVPGDGKPPSPVPGTEFVIKADLAFLALGFVGPVLGTMATPQNFAPDKFGRIGPGLYAAGDAVTGPSLVVRAIASGLRTAETVISDHLGSVRTGAAA
ncbi:MAG: glutamate synthase subunit beta [Deltaproteobacteria bacterium]|nr:glutamate synthase subunit beta [Deltaproteobacteria bacterium]